MYTRESVFLEIESDRESLFAHWSRGRPSNWSCDPRTRDLICTAEWLKRKLRSLVPDEIGRHVLESQFHRFSRSEDDLFSLAARIVNDAADDKIDRDRRPHRRWG